LSPSKHVERRPPFCRSMRAELSPLATHLARAESSQRWANPGSSRQRSRLPWRSPRRRLQAETRHDSPSGENCTSHATLKSEARQRPRKSELGQSRLSSAGWWYSRSAPSSGNAVCAAAVTLGANSDIALAACRRSVIRRGQRGRYAELGSVRLIVGGQARSLRCQAQVTSAPGRPRRKRTG
jgi:hypothetical protein